MTRFYCDFCDKEIVGDNQPHGGPIHCKDRLGGEIKAKNGTTLKVEIMTHVNGVANGGHVCKDCIIKAVLTIGKREKPSNKRDR